MKKILTSVELLFGVLFSLIGLINLCWGNDPFYGLFVFILSLIYYPLFQNLLEKIVHWVVPGWLKIIVGLFILWSSLGVAELFNKIELMVKSFQ